MADINFQWYKNGNLTEKAKAYLSLTYKNQYSQGSFYNNKDKAKELISKTRRKKKEKIVKSIKEREKGGIIGGKKQYRYSIAYNFIPLNSEYHSAIIQVFLDNEDPRIEKRAESILRDFIANHIGYNEWENWADKTLQIGSGWQLIPKTSLTNGYFECRWEDNSGKAVKTKPGNIYN